MKKFASIAASTLLLVSTLTACGTQTSIAPVLQDNTVQAQSASKVTLSFNKKNSTATKTPSNAVKNATFTVGNKSDKGQAKKADSLVVKFTAPSNKNDLSPQEAASISRYTLSSMNQASTYQEGYNIGIQALGSMAGNGNNVYIARVAWAAANATNDWQDGFKMIAAALNQIGGETPNTAYATVNLVIKMMGTAQTYQDGYKAGYAAMQVIGQTDNKSVRIITDLALRQAGSTTDWQNGYNVLVNAFGQLATNFNASN